MSCYSSLHLLTVFVFAGKHKVLDRYLQGFAKKRAKALESSKKHMAFLKESIELVYQHEIQEASNTYEVSW